MPKTQGKRWRFVSVCSNCKLRKTKCDRGNPCLACKKKSIQETCKYTDDIPVSKPYVISANKPMNMLIKGKEKINDVVPHYRDAEEHVNGSRKSSSNSKEMENPNVRQVDLPPKDLALKRFDAMAENEASKNRCNTDNIVDTRAGTEVMSENTVGRRTSKAYLLKRDLRSVNKFRRTRGRSDYESFVGLNPFSLEKDLIIFYPDTRRKLKGVNSDSSGPLSWTSTIRKDFALSILWNEYVHRLEPNHDRETVVEEDTSAYCKYKSSMAILSHQKSDFEYNLDKLKIFKRELNDDLLDIIPPRDVMLILIERFFTWVYPYVPFLDEYVFKSQINRILSDASIELINIFAWSDYAYLGILLIVLRFSSLSYLSNSQPDSNVFNEDDDSTIYSPKVDRFDLGPRLFDVSLKCMVIANYNKGDDFPVFLLSLFIKLYFKYSPEGVGLNLGEERDVKEINKILIQRARAVGLDKIGPIPSSFEVNYDYLKRKIWCFLIMADLSQSYSFGYLTQIPFSCFDTVPSFTIDESNLINKDLDQEVSNFFFLSCNLSPSLRPLLRAISMRDGCKVGALCGMISNFEKQFNKEFGSLEICLKAEDADIRLETFKRQFSVKSYLAFSTFLVSIFFHLFLHFEISEYNLAFLYLKKALLLISELQGSLPTLFHESNYSCDFIINTTIEKFTHRANQILLAVLFRISIIKYKFEASRTEEDEESAEYVSLLTDIKEVLLKCINNSISILSCLSKNYADTRCLIKVSRVFLDSLLDLEVIKRISIYVFDEKPIHMQPTYFQLADIRSIMECSNAESQELVKHPEIENFELNFSDLDFELNFTDLDFDFRDNILDFSDYFAERLDCENIQI
ncbi:uncharacterized protein PRCAT00002224001 [Priceomyces carsonii]|uniref:uncharacterized protein n=1 Tax=Priceomyces carsonii TaxID=28549 RepID=UPI002EDA2EF9|nr:unnamed protein product [Priceomyces carsonii]